MFTTCWWKFVVLDLDKPVFFKTGHHLLLAPLHQGICPQQSLPDGSEQAQVDPYGMSSRYATRTLGAKAHQYGSASLRTTYFRCVSQAEASGSAWDLSWDGTYYRYKCTGHDAEAAFAGDRITRCELGWLYGRVRGLPHPVVSARPDLTARCYKTLGMRRRGAAAESSAHQVLLGRSPRPQLLT